MSDMSSHPTVAKKAVLYRMVMPEHVCPWGLKAQDLLHRSGYEVEDHHLKTRAETLIAITEMALAREQDDFGSSLQ